MKIRLNILVASMLFFGNIGLTLEETGKNRTVESLTEPFSISAEKLFFAPPEPDAPIIDVTEPTCSDGSAKISNFDEDLIYHFDPTGPSVDENGNIVDFDFEEDYTITVENEDGEISSPSAPFSIGEKYSKPDLPIAVTKSSSCVASQSDIEILNFDSDNDYEFAPAGPTVTNDGKIENTVLGGQYEIYAVNGNCKSGASFIAIPNPNPPEIDLETNQLCSNEGTVTFEVTDDTPTGGEWSSDDNSVISIDNNSGEATIHGGGSVTIKYDNGGGCEDEATVFVSEMPDASIEYEDSPFCSSDDDMIQVNHSGDGSGFYTVSPADDIDFFGNGAVDLENSEAGDYTVTYTIPGQGGCPDFTTTASIEIKEAPEATIEYGTAPFCTSEEEGQEVTIVGDGGGTFSIEPATAELTESSGEINPSESEGGIYTVTYTIEAKDGCDEFTTTTLIEIVEKPNAGEITGDDELCEEGTLTLTSDGDSGGTWSSDDEGVLIVDENTGEITAIGEGTANITYTVEAVYPCTVDDEATLKIEVTAKPNAGTIVGTQDYCVGEEGTLTIEDGDAGGKWSSSDETVIIVDEDSGEIEMLESGSAIISYTIEATSPCTIDDIATIFISVGEPADAGEITGNNEMCEGGTITLTSDGDSGGKWSSNNEDVLIVDENTGLVSAVGEGTTNIIYTVEAVSPCMADDESTFEIEVTALPNAGTINGDNEYCKGETTILTIENGDNGGKWSSSNENVVIVDENTGEMEALSSGVTTIFYTVESQSPCTVNDEATLTVSVGNPPNPGNISGVSDLCQGSSVPFSTNGDSGGTWISSDPDIIAIDENTGAATALSGGSAVISYLIEGLGECDDESSTFPITVEMPPDAGTIQGEPEMCAGDLITLTSDGDGGGTWSSSNTSIALIDENSGEIITLSDGNVTFTYTVTATSPCQVNSSADYNVTISSVANAGNISGENVVCAGESIPLSSSGDTGGIWTVDNENYAIIGENSGILEGISEGVVQVTYFVVGNGGCEDVGTTYSVEIMPVPDAGEIIGENELGCASQEVTLETDGTQGGIWSSSNTDVATIDQSGKVTAHSDGTTIITYQIEGVGTCSSSQSTFELMVGDNQPPIFEYCPEEIEIHNEEGECGVHVEWSLPIALDNCDNSLNITSNYESGDYFPLGVTTVHYVAEDGAGNQATCSFNITVIDAELPEIINCPEDPIVAYSTEDSCGVVVKWEEMSATDNCLLGDLQGNHESGSIFPQGSTLVTYTATDMVGNESICSFTVQVVDTISPVIEGISQSDTIIGCFDEPLAWTPPTVADNCGVISFESNHSPGDILPPGYTEITYTATDESGNTTQESFVLYVKESMPDIVLGDFEFLANDVFIGCDKDDSLIVNVISPNHAYSYIWTDEEGEELMEGEKFVLENVEQENEGFYYITSYDEDGCSFTQEFEIELYPCKVKISEIMTPNGDGYNDNFVIENIEDYQGTKVWIYDRWGIEVFYSENYSNNWSGISQSNINIGKKQLPEGTYYYIVELGEAPLPNSREILKGHVYIKHD